MNRPQGLQTSGMQSSFGPNMGYQSSTPLPSTGYSTLPYQVPQGQSPFSSSMYGGAQNQPMGYGGLPYQNPNQGSAFGGGFSGAFPMGPMNFDQMRQATQGAMMKPAIMDTAGMLPNQNPMARSMQADFGPLPPGPTSLPYGNQSGQNGLVYTNGQFGFGPSAPVQLAPGTAAALGARSNGRGQYVDAQGNVVGLV